MENSPQLDISNYIRVSTVLDYFKEPELVEWMIKKGPSHKKIGKQAMKIGTEVDEAVKNFVVSGTYGKVKSLEAKSCLQGFKRWFEDYKPSLTLGKRLFNEEWKITGEPDIYWADRIIDIKCASEIRLKYFVQTGAYALLDQKNATGILRLHKHLEDYEYVERNGLEVCEDQEIFFHMFKTFQYFNKPLLAEKREQHADSPADNTF